MPGLRHLGVAAALGAVVWIGDFATGRHLQTSLSDFATRLGAWYESERLPAVLCKGSRVPYTSLPEVTFSVPECWRHEVLGLLDREVHHFYDPDARAGMVSVSVESAATAEDREALQREFTSLASVPHAEVHEAETAASPRATPVPEPGLSRRDGADSLAERIAPSKPAAETQRGAGRGPSPFRKVETSAVLGVGSFPIGESGETGFADRPSSSGEPMAVVSWLLLSEDLAVRIQYLVREDWSTDSIVSGEIRRVRDLVSSVRPAR